MNKFDYLILGAIAGYFLNPILHAAKAVFKNAYQAYLKEKENR